MRKLCKTSSSFKIVPPQYTGIKERGGERKDQKAKFKFKKINTFLYFLPIKCILNKYAVALENYTKNE